MLLSAACLVAARVSAAAAVAILPPLLAHPTARLALALEAE
jgi:hypothetical protein